MTRRASVRFTALLTVLALTICATPAWVQTPRAERPAYKVGDKWIRSDGTYELTRMDKDVYVFVAGRGNEVHLSRDLGLAKIVADGRVTFDVEPAAGLSWPLAIGKWGIKYGVWRLSPPKPTATPLFTGNVTITWKVEGAEDVRVAAGSFRALRISHVIESARGPAMSGVNFGDFVLWYAPDLGLFVKAQGSLPGMTWELAGLDRPGAPPAIVTPPAPVAPSPAPPAVAQPAPAPPPAPAVGAAARAAKAERPTYQVGDRWIRNDGTYELARIEKDVYVFVAGRGNEIRLSKNLDLLSVIRDGRVEFDLDPGLRLTWPLETGGGSQYRGVWRSVESRLAHGSFTGAVDVTWKVEGESEVTVPAGTFWAHRIKHTIFAISWVGGAGPGLDEVMLWYAPDIARFVKGESRNVAALNFELMGLDRPAPVVTGVPAARPPRPAPPVVAQPAPAPAPPAVRTPPAIALLEPKSGAVHRGDQATLRVEVKSEGRVRSLVVRGRGGDQTLTPPQGVKAGEVWAVEVMVPLAEGANVVRLEAVDEHGSRAAETVTLTRQSLIAVEFQGPAGTTLQVEQDRHTLDAQGTLTLQLPPGTYRIEATKDGFLPLRQTLRLAPRQGKATQRLALVQAVPPAIALLDPKPGAPLRTPDAKLRIEVKSRYRLSALRVGKEGESAQQAFAPGATTKVGEAWVVEALVLLSEGANRIRLEAVDEHGTRAEQTVTLTRQPPAVAAPPAPAPPVPPPPAVAAPSADTEAPKIAINYPPPETKVEREQIVVLGLVTDNVAVDRVQVTVNGVEVAQPRDIGVVGRGVPIRVPAALQPGDNLIEITAADKAGNVMQVVRTVTRLAPAPAAAPVVKVTNRWAVVIGIGEYEHKAIPRLRFAVRDAEAMYTFLTTKGGYPKQNVLLLTDTTAEKPTLQNIRRALGDFLFRRPGRDDMVLIYYAGHGAPEVDAAGAESDGLSKYLIPRNADPDSLYSTAFPMDEIQKVFARIPSERVVMLLDTCYSGTAGGRTFARQQIRSGNLSDQFLERLTRSRGRVVITASGPNEVALESPDLGHGIFTYYLLEGLGGKADRNGDGLVTVSELYEYVEDKVDRAARLAGGRQRPLMKGEIEGTLPLSRTAR